MYKYQKMCATLLASTRSSLSIYAFGNQPAFPLHSPSAQPLFDNYITQGIAMDISNFQ
jgi:hypothetical protein